MDCWTVLGIERFSDKKSIKIAYAKQLKLHRPDDDPEGFQQLHRAYKSALSWVPDSTDGKLDWIKLQDEPSDKDLTLVLIESLKTPFDDVLISIPGKIITPVTVAQPTLLGLDHIDEMSSEIKTQPELCDADRQLLDEIHSQENLLSEDWQRLFHSVNEIVKSKTASNDIEQWQFIESLESMNELEFRKASSDQVFEVVAKANTTSLDNQHLHIKRPVLDYLNKQFSWDKKWQDYQSLYSRRMLNAVYPYLEEANKPAKGISKKRELYYFRRGAAFAIDLSIICLPFIIYSILNSVLVDPGAESLIQKTGFDGASVFILWTIIYFLILIPVQEASKYQATVGKRFLHLQVIDKRGDRISFFHAFWRSLLTMFCCIGVKVVFFINIALSCWRSEILQDTLSRSYVILRPGYFHK